MNNLTYSEIQEQLKKLDILQLPELTITVLRNIMLEPIEPYLRFHSYKMGYNAKILFGEYDNIFQETVGGSIKLFNEKTDCIFIFMYLETFSWNLSRNFASLDDGAIQSELDMIYDQIDAVLAGIRRQTNAMVLWHSFEVPVEPCFGICDSQIVNGQSAVIQALNDILQKRLREAVNMYFVDMNRCVSRIGARSFYDWRYWHIGRAPYTREALREISFEDFKFIRPLKGKNKKCLVLDCDNTLWGGIIGEDGLSGIKLGKTYPGSAYYEFQQEIVNLFHRGVIIALCSKNNENDVWEVFRNHPDMLLKEEHIATAQINWQDKALNLRQIALDLNIGIDSMVFIDDSEFEINLIQKEIPEVETIHLPSDQAVYYRHILAACSAFDTLTISHEDRNRGRMYKTEVTRKKQQLHASDMNSYYAFLEMIVEIRLADDFSVPRIAQQTQKTNQFNLTTRRYSEADIKRFMSDESSVVMYLKLSDRFGDSGIVGTCILKFEKNVAVIDSFLLSCRVLGRGVEDLFLIRTLKLAKKHGCNSVQGTYYPTGKNQQVELFYSQRGFKEIDGQSTGPERTYYYDLTWQLPQEQTYFKEIISDID